MTDDWKTLRVPKDAYQEAKAQKEEEGRTWGEQIVRPVEETSTIGDMTVEELQNVLSESVDSSGGGVSADDIQTAVRSAIREELPDRVFQG